jgi:cytochrome c oxidase cbb3-type subunit III
MSSGHSIFIIVLTLANIAGAVWLLWWMRRQRGETTTATQTTGHVWDEDLRELNNPLPRWWLWLFIITVLFGGVYLAVYPGLGNFQGTRGWTSRAEHDAQRDANAARIERALAPFAQRPASELVSDAAAVNVGRNLFLNNCAACHGSDGGGAPGFPSLADEEWLWGGDPDTVVASIAQGRNGMMPPWEAALGESGVEDMLSYVFSLQGRTLSAGNTRAGGEKFAQLCAACHGADARGNPQLGVPNLTDGVWLHGGSLAAVRDSIGKGRGGTMPAHLDRLGPTRVNLLAAYVLSLRAQETVTTAASSAH